MCRQTSSPESDGSSHPRFGGGALPRRLSIEQAARLQKFRVQDRRTCGAANCIVAQDNKAIVEHAVWELPSNGDAHAASRIAVHARLWPIFFIAHDHGVFRRRK